MQVERETTTAIVESNEFVENRNNTNNETIEQQDKNESKINLGELVKQELKRNNNKISEDFFNKIAYGAKVTHVNPTKNTRVCVVTLKSGHELVGYAQVLDSANDVRLIGQEIAYKNAIKNLWSTLGNIAKIYI